MVDIRKVMHAFIPVVNFHVAKEILGWWNQVTLLTFKSLI